jgi:predicted DCC family thiol-disulfide oxidoreductase YuxK
MDQRTALAERKQAAAAYNLVGDVTRGKPMNEGPFTLLYDGDCPFCRREVQWLKRRDQHGRIVAEDISREGFRAEAYGLSQEEVMGVLHGVFPDGRIVRRLEAIREVYRVVGLGWLVAPLSWPILNWFADKAYGIFARNRMALGRLFGRKCEGSCNTSTPRP